MGTIFKEKKNDEGDMHYKRGLKCKTGLGENLSETVVPADLLPLQIIECHLLKINHNLMTHVKHICHVI